MQLLVVMIQEDFIKISKTSVSNVNSVDWDNLIFGHVFTDHMLIMDYKDGKWQTPEIMPFGPIQMHPAMSAIHYGQTIFEGMKAYRKHNGQISLFRPEMNASRFAESAVRMAMPPIPEDLFVELIRAFVEVESAWIPSKKGYSLYLRPLLYATDEYIGIRPSENYRFLIFACPVGAYYSEPVNVKIEEFYTRASVGGVGRTKTAGNYASSLYPANLAKKDGFHQLLWTDGLTHEYIEESGTMNVMFVIDGKFVTPSEDNDTILKGTTKRTVIDLAKSWGMVVEERKVSVAEVIQAIRDKRLTEAFGAGTAATIAHIAKIGFRDEVLELPAIESRTFSLKALQYIDDVKLGDEPDALNWLVNV